jgi:hypothetical protein
MFEVADCRRERSDRGHHGGHAAWISRSLVVTAAALRAGTLLAQAVSAG